MIEIPDKLNFHNFNLECKPKLWFKRRTEESATDWLSRVAIQGDDFDLFRWRTNNKYWLDSSSAISLCILKFLRKNKMTKNTLEELIEFELDLQGSYDWRLSELKKIELHTGIKLA